MSAQLPIGIVGLNFGRHIVDQIVTGPAAVHLRLAAVCDLDADKAADFGRRFAVPAYTSLAALLAAPEIPAVGLFTGPQGRAQLLQQIIAAGKDVITTKPFENDPEAALAVLQQAAELGRVLQLNSPAPLLSPDLARIQTWRETYGLGRPIGCRADVWVSYREQPDGRWLDDPELCPVAPVFRLGIYLINDLIRLLGNPARVQVMSSRIFTARPTADNAQLGIAFDNGCLANIFASFCVLDGDHYRNSLILNYENGTVYRNVGAARAAAAGAELSVVMARDGQRQVVDQAVLPSCSGEYQWDAFVRAVRGEDLGETVSPAQVVAGLRVIRAMRESDQSGRQVAVS